MAKGNSQKTANDSGLDFEAQLWAAAEQAVPESHCNRREWWPCASTKSEWFIKDEPQRAEAGENRDFFSLSASNGERAGVRCRNSGMNRRGGQSVRGQRRPCASTTTWKLARMNLAIRGIDANLGPRNADSFRADLHPDLKADFILAKPTTAP